MFQRIIILANKPPKLLAAVVAFTTTTLVACWCESSSSSHRSPSQPHQTLTFPNKKKNPTVLVIGDVHGCYDEMIHLHKVARQQQQQQNQDIEFDAVICVGDLVNKGPKSAEAIRHVRQQPNWYTVRGNHEEGALRFVHHENKQTKNSKYAWTSQLTEDDIEWMEELPYTIWIEPFQTMIVHSGLMPGVPLEQQTPDVMINMRDINEAPWAQVWNDHPSSLYKIIFGHDAKRGLQTFPKAIGLDTGCCYGKVLTGIILPQGTFVQVPARQVYCPIRAEE